MNTDNNRRFKETEEKITAAFGRLAFQKPLDKITVSDICKEADIHRTTFYGHFEDILQLQSYVETIHFKQTLESLVIDQNCSIRDYTLMHLNFFYSYRRQVKGNFLSSSAGGRLNDAFMNSLSRNLEESYKKYFNIDNDTDFMYHQTYINAGSVAVIKKWILNDCQESPEKMADILCNLLSI